jgi:hypothetical protein
MRYPIVVHKDPESGYGVTVPDLPGGFSVLDKYSNKHRESHSGLIAGAATAYITSSEDVAGL